jgi:hypothetical protein
MRKFFAVALLASSVLAAMPAQAQVTYYTDQAAFLAALGGSAVTEDFNDATLVPGLTYVSTVGSIGGGVFNDQLAEGAQTTTFSFGGSVNAFGGFFDLTPGGQGVGIAITTAPGATLATQIDRNYAGGFFGFISHDSFSSVLLTAGNQANGVETYNLNDLTFGTAAGVPEPAAWGMMIGGFGLAGAAMRRRVTKVAFAA